MRSHKVTTSQSHKCSPEIQNRENLEKAIDLSWIEEIDNINNLEELRKYYKLNE